MNVICVECGEVYGLVDAEAIGELECSHGVCPLCEDVWVAKLEDDLKKSGRQDDELLGRVDEFAAGVSDDLTVEEMKKDLEAAGVDVDGMVSAVQDLLDTLTRG